jgi:hypothetical protein
VSNYEPLTGLLGRRLGGILLGGTSMLLVVASTAAYPLLLLLLYSPSCNAARCGRAPRPRPPL